MRRTLVLFLLVAAVTLLGPASTQAKGYAGPAAFRISGGDLPHPVVVSVAESEMATASAQGTWYTTPSGLPEPPAGSTRYRIDLVDAAGNAVEGNTPQEYVAGPPARIASVDGPGWAEPIAPIRDLLDRYIDLDRRGQLTEHPTFADAVAASREIFGVAVTANGRALEADVGDEFVRLASQAAPVVFGVRGTLIGQRDLHAVQIEVRFGAGSLAFAYVPPGPVARFGLLFNRAQLGNWELVTMLDPPGYAQYAYTVPPELDRLMNDAGFRGADEGALIDSHVVPLDEAQLTFGEDRIEVWRGGGRHVRLALPDAYDSSTTCQPGECPSPNPVPPFGGNPVNVEIWPRGVDPFREAVLPAELTYYSADATHSGRGVLVQSRGGAEFNGTFGDSEPPYYADATMDALLRHAAAQLDRPPGRSAARAVVVGVPAVILGVLAIVWTSLDAERKRRRHVETSEQGRPPS